ncbi:universal stress protein [Paenarthrobacter sp. TYUT067]|uniref:universal stress protein n=1 Tax=Paenarthrobacter sp. TYUT067 TaxID=2926245 RepID=UPI00202E4B96|nr:universal stress protein [Paenarthrobacter sp. TYUT067]MCM0615024.1 universal stress protein [Paenarthrobacter sp. TYUT067]
MNTHSRSDRIVVGVDGSEYSSNTLQMAGRMAAALGGPLEVTTCIGMSDYYLASRFEPELTRFTTELEDTAERLVEEALERAFGADRPKDLTVTVKFGEPAKVLVEESHGAQLLVVGRRGSGGFFNQPMGSVSRACSAHAQCPVLVVTQDKKG